MPSALQAHVHCSQPSCGLWHAPSPPVSRCVTPCLIACSYHVPRLATLQCPAPTHPAPAHSCPTHPNPCRTPPSAPPQAPSYPAAGLAKFESDAGADTLACASDDAHVRLSSRSSNDRGPEPFLGGAAALWCAQWQGRQQRPGSGAARDVAVACGGDAVAS